MDDKKFRILLVSPVSEYKAYVLPHWIRYVKSLERSYNSGIVSLDILLCDNSQNAQYYKQLQREFKINIIHVNPQFKNSREFICESRNAMADYFLSHTYNYMLSLECDLFPHPNFISDLLAHNKKIVSFQYMIGEGDQSSPMITMVDSSPEDPRNTRQISLTEMFQFTGKLMPVFNAGLGCTLIKRQLIEKVPFRWDKENFYHDDSFFAEDLYNKGIKWYCDFTRTIRHLNKPWNYFPESKF